MKKITILCVAATVALLPELRAQEPAPVSQGAIVSTQTFVNGQEITPPRAVINVSGSVTAKPEPACANPGCTCGPAPKPCECTPEQVCGPNAAPSAPSKACDKPVSTAQFVIPARPTMKLIVNGKELSPVAVSHRGKPCSKRPVKKVRRADVCTHAEPPMPGDMAPCGKARPFGMPVQGALPPCAHRHGRMVVSSQAAPARPMAAPTAVHPCAPKSAPQAVRVIINGVETIIPLIDEGVNITIKPL